MLTPWLDLPAVRDRLRWASAVTGLDLVALGTTGSDDEIRDTAVAQPLLVALASAVAAELGPAGDLPVRAVAGHSVGEYAAAAVAGAMSTETALALVGARGRLMAQAAAARPTGMTAVLGGDEDVVLATLARHGCVAANVNGAGQVVAAGPVEALAALAADPPPGARLRPLSVAGAFHTDAMEPARAALAEIAAAAPVRAPRLPFVSNADGALVNDGAALRRRLVDQVAAPVRWDRCMATLTDLGVTAVVELPPGGTLTGLAKRAMPGVTALALRSPDNLPAARALLEQHHVVPEPVPSWRLAVAPVAGTFRPLDLAPGDPVPAGAPVGTIVAQRQEAAIQAAHAGVLVEWLAHDGDPVSPGQPVALLHPEPAA